MKISVNLSCLGFNVAGSHFIHCQRLLCSLLCSLGRRATLVAFHARRVVLSLANYADRNTGDGCDGFERGRIAILSLHNQVRSAGGFDFPIVGHRFLESLEDKELSVQVISTYTSVGPKQPQESWRQTKDQT